MLQTSAEGLRVQLCTVSADGMKLFQGTQSSVAGHLRTFGGEIEE
ncbi:hypothetical protein ACIQH5_02670 [Paenarthrobacter sp. NPDC091711]